MTGTATPEFDAVILAGGRGARMGGARKPELQVHGRPLLDYAVTAAAPARRTVVVGPADLRVPHSVVLTQEDPPLSGPVAALAAGLAALDREGAAPAWVLLLAADLPGARSAVGALLAANWTGDGTVLTDPDGRAQWLAGIYRRAALGAALADLPTTEGAALHALMRPLTLIELPASGTAVADVDTWADLHAAQNAVMPTHGSIYPR